MESRLQPVPRLILKEASLRLDSISGFCPMMKNIRIHPTAEVSPQAEIGQGSVIWRQVQIREGARLGQNCIVGKGVYIDFGVQIGSNVKIQNSALIYHGVTLEDGVFIGPQVCLTNDKLPRAINPDGTLKGTDDWQVSPILVRQGAAIGAGAVILPGVIIGRWAMIGSGAVVTRNVPDYGLVWGNPARLRGFVCPCGQRLQAAQTQADQVLARCPACHWENSFAVSEWESLQP